MSIRFVFILLTSLLVALGCAGENEFTSPPQIRFDGPKYQCLSDADRVMKDFIEARLSPVELSSFWDCLDSAVVKFVKFVSGREGKNYTPIEIAKFIDDFFLDGRGLIHRTELIAEMMQLKRLFLGGSLQRISYEDLYGHTRELIQNFKQISLQINPHMKALHGSLTGQLDGLNASEVTAATEALSLTGEQLAQLVKKSRHVYSFTHFEGLLTEIESFIQQRNPDFNIKQVKKYLPLLSEFKGLVVAPPQDLVGSEDWSRLLESMFNIVGWGAQYRFNIEMQGWDQGQAFETLTKIINGALLEFDKGLQVQEKNEFSFVDLDRIMERLEVLDLLPLDIDAPTAKTVIRRIAERVLDPQSGPGTGLNKGDLLALRQEVDRWIEAQRYLNHEVEKGIDLDVADADGGSEMRMLMRTRWPMLVDKKGRLIFSKDTFQSRYDRKSLSTLNWQRALMRGLMRGYAKQTSGDGATGLSRDDMIILAEDWHVLAEKMGLFEPGAGETMAKKIFMEANLFMPSSNGDERIDFVEAVQYLAFAISGMNSSSDIQDSIKSTCVAPNTAKKFIASCVRSELFAQRENLLENFPFLLEFIGDSPEVWTQFEAMIEATTRDGVSEQPIGGGDLIEMIVLVHYIETFFATYDQTGNQLINVDETLRAFPVFRLSLKEIVKNSFGVNMSNNDLKGLLTYLFKYGKPPQSSFGGAVKFLNWLWHPEKWQYEANRLRVIQILAELNSRR